MTLLTCLRRKIFLIVLAINCAYYSMVLSDFYQIWKYIIIIAVLSVIVYNTMVTMVMEFTKFVVAIRFPVKLPFNDFLDNCSSIASCVAIIDPL